MKTRVFLDSTYRRIDMPAFTDNTLCLGSTKEILSVFRTLSRSCLRDSGRSRFAILYIVGDKSYERPYSDNHDEREQSF